MRMFAGGPPLPGCGSTGRFDEIASKRTPGFRHPYLLPGESLLCEHSGKGRGLPETKDRGADHAAEGSKAA